MPQQYALFADFQRLSHRDLPAGAKGKDRKILEPVKPVVMRWNSYYNYFERAVKLQPAGAAYANHHLRCIHDEDTYATT
jgi:hypothetical protein